MLGSATAILALGLSFLVAPALADPATANLTARASTALSIGVFASWEPVERERGQMTELLRELHTHLPDIEATDVSGLTLLPSAVLRTPGRPNRGPNPRRRGYEPA